MYHCKNLYERCRHFQLEVRCTIKTTRGHVLLSFNTTTRLHGLCTLEDNGATKHHHTSVSCRSKVCLITKMLALQSDLKPLTSDPQNRQNLPNFGRDLENFCSISHLTLGVSRVNTPYSSLEPNKIVIVNRQCGVGNSNMYPNFA